MDVDASSWAIGDWSKVLHLRDYDNSLHRYDDLDGSSIDAGLGMKDVASLVFFLVMLEGQDFGDNKCGT